MVSRRGLRPTGRTAVVALMLGAAAFSTGDAKAASATTCDGAINGIQRYCSACWRNARIPVDSWSDCTQEVLCRLMKNIPLNQWDRVLKVEGDERKEFVRAIDAVKKRTQRARKWSPMNEDAVDYRNRSGHELADRREELNRVADVLSARQNSIIRMSIDGHSVQDMADALKMSPERVSDEKYKAIRKLRRELGIEM